MKLFTKIFFTGNLRGASAVIWNFFLYNLQVEKSEHTEYQQL